MTSTSKVAAYLTNHAAALSIEIVESVLGGMKLTIPEEEKQQAITMYVEFIGFLGETLTDNLEAIPEELIVWSKKNAAQQVSSGRKISEISIRYLPTREVFADIVTKLSMDFALSVEENASIIKRVNTLLDVSHNEMILAFEHLSDLYQEKMQKDMAELSAPIVLIRKDVAVLPLIGVIDSYRASYIMEKVVPKIADLQVEYVITDCSGILTIDLDIAHYLRQLSEVLLLLGVNIILTSLRPELTQFIVNSGIDMSAIKTFAHVKQALEYIK